MKAIKIKTFNKTNKKCYNNNMNNYQLKDILLRKLLNTLENVLNLLKKELKLRVKKKRKNNKKIIDIKVRKKIFLFDKKNIN